jgi:phospholipid transport system substrate-binding protein
METKRIKRFSSLTSGVLLLFVPVFGTAGPPTAQLRQTVDRLLEALRNPQFQGEARKEERREKLREIILPKFDFAEMAKRSLGAHWQRRTPDEQKEFVKIFTSLLEGTYLDTIESYNGEKVQYLNERGDKNFAEVDTKIIDQKGKEFALNYRLHNIGGEWKIYDVVIENISLVNNYRAQFGRVLAKSSYEQLLLAMKEKRLGAPATKS